MTVEVVVEMAFGVAAGAVPAEEDWVDVTEDVEAVVGSPVVRATTGRLGDRTSITPGTCEFDLISHAGIFNPRNADGPYFGNLVNGVPIRIRMRVLPTDVDGSDFGMIDFGMADFGASGGGTGELVTRWTGTLRTGWPQQVTVGDPTISMEGHDTVGLAAFASMPLSAWDAYIGALDPQPGSWWRCGADGWICRVTGRTARHTSGLVEAPAVVDGGDPSHRSTDLGEGRGVVDIAPFVEPLDFVAWPFAISMWVQLERPEITDRMVTLLHQVDDAGRTQVKVQIDPASRRARITLASGAGGWRWWSPFDERLPLLDGRVHHVMIDGGFNVDMGDESGIEFLARLYIDGKQVDLTAFEDEEAPATSDDGYRLYLGGGRADKPGDADAESGTPVMNATGVVDHVLIFNDHPWLDDRRRMAQIAKAFTTVGRLAWAGDLMDERLERLLDVGGLGALTGALDDSGITTRQGYRVGELLPLLQQVEETEQGRVSCDALGLIRFSARGWAWNDERSTTVQATFSDYGLGGFDMVTTGTVIDDTPEGVVNAAEVTSTNGRTQYAEDAGSIAANGRREVTLTGLLHDSDRQSQSVAEWLVLSQKDAQIRVRQLTFDATTIPALSLFASTVAEGDLIRVRKAPALDCEDDEVGDVVDVVNIDAHVVGIEFNWEVHRLLVTLTLDSTRTGYDQWFTWGVSNWGDEEEWDSNTLWAF